MQREIKPHKLNTLIPEDVDLIFRGDDRVLCSRQAIVNLLNKTQEDELKRIIEIIQSNCKGSFTDEAGNDCWYIDDLIKLLNK